MAERSQVKGSETRADPHVPAGAPGGEKRLRLPLKTMDDVKVELARLYREGKVGRRHIADVSKLANVLGILGRLIEGAEFEARLQALEQSNEGDGARPGA